RHMPMPAARGIWYGIRMAPVAENETIESADPRAKLRVSRRMGARLQRGAPIPRGYRLANGPVLQRSIRPLRTEGAQRLIPIRNLPWKALIRDVKRQVEEDNVWNGAAALAFYLVLAIFPALIFLLSVLPYLPIPNLDREIMDLLHRALPGEAAALL